MSTSVYLSNHSVQVAIGESKGKKVNIERLFNIDLEEGNLINGVILSQEGLQTQLSEIWERYQLPKDHVELMIDSTQITSKVIEIPKMKEKEIRPLVEREFPSLENNENYLFDYRVISIDSKTKKQKLLCSAVSREIIEGFYELFLALEIPLDSISIAQNGILKMLERNPKHQQESYIVSILDGKNLINLLMIQGEYNYFNRTRIFNEQGTPEFSQEIGKSVSAILQFLSTQNKDVTVKDIYLAGFTNTDLVPTLEVLRGLGLEMMIENQIPLVSMPTDVQVTYTTELAACSGYIYEFIFTIGNLVHEKKDINYVSFIENGNEKKTVKNVELKIFAGVFAVCLLCSLALIGYNFYLNSKIQDAQAYIENQVNIDRYNEAKQLEEQIENQEKSLKQLVNIKDVLESYPAANTNVEKEMEKSAGNKVSLSFSSYDATTGEYTFTAMANKVTDIYSFIKELEKSNLFATLTYSGYNYTEQTKQYNIKVTGKLSETAGK